MSCREWLYAKVNYMLNVYCPECPPGGIQLDTRGWTAKKVFAVRSRKGHAAFNGTGLQNKSFQDRAEISKA